MSWQNALILLLRIVMGMLLLSTAHFTMEVSHCKTRDESCSILSHTVGNFLDRDLIPLALALVIIPFIGQHASL